MFVPGEKKKQQPWSERMKENEKKIRREMDLKLGASRLAEQQRQREQPSADRARRAFEVAEFTGLNEDLTYKYLEQIEERMKAGQVTKEDIISNQEFFRNIATRPAWKNQTTEQLKGYKDLEKMAMLPPEAWPYTEEEIKEDVERRWQRQQERLKRWQDYAAGKTQYRVPDDYDIFQRDQWGEAGTQARMKALQKFHGGLKTREEMEEDVRRRESMIAGQGKIGIGEEFDWWWNEDRERAVPHVGQAAQLAKDWDLWRAAQRMEKGIESEEDFDMLLQWGRVAQAMARRGRDAYAVAFSVLPDLTSIGGEFAIGFGIGRAAGIGARMAFRKYAINLLRKQSSRALHNFVRGVGKRVAKPLVTGVVTGMVMAPARVIGGVVSDISPQGYLEVEGDDYKFKVVAGTGDHIMVAVPRNVLRWTAEAMVERWGGKLLPWGAKNKMLQNRAFQRVAVSEFGKSFRKITKGFERAGLHSPPAEVMEEVVMDFTNSMIDLKPWNLPLTEGGMTAEELGGMALGFAPLAFVGAAFGASARMRRRSREKAYLKKLGDFAEKAKQRQTPPQTVEKVFKKKLQEGQETLHVPKKVWDDYWRKQGEDPEAVAETVTGSTKTYDRAKKMNSDIEIPTEKAVTRIFGSTKHRAFGEREFSFLPSDEFSLPEEGERMKEGTPSERTPIYTEEETGRIRELNTEAGELHKQMAERKAEINALPDTEENQKKREELAKEVVRIGNQIEGKRAEYRGIKESGIERSRLTPKEEAPAYRTSRADEQGNIEPGTLAFPHQGKITSTEGIKEGDELTIRMPDGNYYRVKVTKVAGEEGRVKVEILDDVKSGKVQVETSDRGKLEATVGLNAGEGVIKKGTALIFSVDENTGEMTSESSVTDKFGLQATLGHEVKEVEVRGEKPLAQEEVGEEFTEEQFRQGLKVTDRDSAEIIGRGEDGVELPDRIKAKLAAEKYQRGEALTEQEESLLTAAYQEEKGRRETAQAEERATREKEEKARRRTQAIYDASTWVAAGDPVPADLQKKVDAIRDDENKTEAEKKELERLDRIIEKNPQPDRVEATDTVKPDQVRPPHEVTSGRRVSDMQRTLNYSGWQWNPILVVQHPDGWYKALTGSHRVAAAQRAGVDIPIYVIPEAALEKYKEARSKNPRDTFWKQAGEKLWLGEELMIPAGDVHLLSAMLKTGDQRAIELAREEERTASDPLAQEVRQFGNLFLGEGEPFHTFPVEKQVPTKDPKPLSKKKSKAIVQSWKDQAKQDKEERGEDNSKKTILSLFDRSGEWSKPWREAGYNVIQIDLEEFMGGQGWQKDIGEIDEEWLKEKGIENVHGIIAAPPCTDFTISGTRWWVGKEKDPAKKAKVEESVNLVHQVLRIVNYYRPDFWAMENPVGRMPALTGVPKKPRMYFQPWHFGDPYRKKTGLWGDLNTDLPLAPVKDTEGSKIAEKLWGTTDEGKFQRSLTPEGFAYAFYMAHRDVMTFSEKVEEFGNPNADPRNDWIRNMVVRGKEEEATRKPTTLAQEDVQPAEDADVPAVQKDQRPVDEGDVQHPEPTSIEGLLGGGETAPDTGQAPAVEDTQQLEPEGQPEGDIKGVKEGEEGPSEHDVVANMVANDLRALQLKQVPGLAKFLESDIVDWAEVEAGRYDQIANLLRISPVVAYDMFRPRYVVVKKPRKVKGVDWEPRGLFDGINIEIWRKGDVSTIIHENAHLWMEQNRKILDFLLAIDSKDLTAEQQLFIDDMDTLAKHAGATDISKLTRAQQEWFAEQVEEYFRKGTLPAGRLLNAVRRLSMFITNVYRGIRKLTPVNPEMEEVIGRMVASEVEVAMASDPNSSVRMEALLREAGATEKQAKEWGRADADAKSQRVATVHKRVSDSIRKQNRQEARELIVEELEEQPKYVAYATITTGKNPDGSVPDKLISGNKPGYKISWDLVKELAGEEIANALPPGVAVKGKTSTGQYRGVDPQTAAEDFGYQGKGAAWFLIEDLVDIAQEIRELNPVYQMEAEIKKEIADLKAQEKDIKDVAKQAKHQETIKTLQERLKKVSQQRRAAERSIKRNGTFNTLVDFKVDEFLKEIGPSEQEIADMAEEAIANDPNLRKITIELNVLAKKSPKAMVGMATKLFKPFTTRMFMEDAMEFMLTEVVGGIKPKTYLSEARKAEKASFRAFKKGDFDTAFEEKQNQMRSMAYFQAATLALNSAERIKKKNDKLKKNSAQARLGRGGGSFMEHLIRNLVRTGYLKPSQAAFDITQNPKSTLQGWYDSLKNTVEAPQLLNEGVISLIEDGVPWHEMTYEQMIALDLFNRSIEFIANDRYKAIKGSDAANQAQFENEAVNSIAAGAETKEEKEVRVPLQELVKRLEETKDPQERAEIEAEIGPLQKKMDGFRQQRRLKGLEQKKSRIRTWRRELAGATMKFWYDCERLDGFKHGLFSKTLLRSYNEATDLETTMLQAFEEQYMKILKKYRKSLSGTKSQPVAGFEGLLLSKNEMLSLILNMGTVEGQLSVRRTLSFLLGREEEVVSQEELDQFTSLITDEQWEYAKEIWGLFDQYKESVAALHKRVKGVPLDLVRGVEIQAGSGKVIQGMYYPLDYDTRMATGKESDVVGEEALQAVLRADSLNAYTAHSHREKRAKNAHYALNLSLNVISRHIHEVIHDLTHHEMLVDGYRTLGNAQIRKAITDYHGADFYNSMKAHLDAVGIGDRVKKDFLDKAGNWMASTTATAQLVGNLSVAAIQVFGVINAATRLGARNLLKGISQTLRHPVDMYHHVEWIHSKSKFMAARTKGSQSIELRKILESNTAFGEKTEKIRKLLAVPMTKMQALADIWVWDAAYAKYSKELGLEQAGERFDEVEAEVVYRADNEVRITQGSGLTADKSAWQRKTGLAKLFSTYSTFFDARNNVFASQIGKRYRSYQETGNPWHMIWIASDFAILYPFQTAATFMATALLRGDDPSDDEVMVDLFTELAVDPFAGIPFVKDVAGAAKGFAYKGSAGEKPLAQLSELIRDIDDPMEWIETAGFALGIPGTSQFKKMADGYMFMDEYGPGAFLLGPSAAQREERRRNR